MKQSMGKDTYMSIEIPKELSELVEQSIISNNAEKQKEKTNRKRKIIFKHKLAIVCTTCAATILLCFTIALNTNEAFAMEMQQIPVIGAVSRILTVRSYYEQDENTLSDLKIPEIQFDDSLSKEVNEEIKTITDAYIAEAKQDFADYKEAYLATGGTEEGWKGHNMAIYVDYKLHSHVEDFMSLELITAKSWVASNEEHHFYNLDFRKNQKVTLEDILGKEYIEICNESILSQIEKRIAEGEDYFEGENGFTTVTPETKFYVNQKGNVVVFFDKYEISPGSMGVQEFEIQKDRK